jgi:hypothetical protein
MPNTSIQPVKDPYNTSGKFKTFPGKDYTGNDILGTIAYSLDACLAACDSYNEFTDSGGCIAGGINMNQEASVLGERANCFLKMKVNVSDVDETNSQAVGFRRCKDEACRTLWGD